MRDLRRLRIVVLGVWVATLASGCGGGANHENAKAPSPSNAAPTNAPSSAIAVPNPFTIVARYSAASLGLTNPRGIAVGPDGNLYVTDARQRVNVIAPGGAVIRRWGRQGSGPGEFRFVTTDPADAEDIAMEIADRNGLVYVADSGNARIEVFTSHGRFVRELRTFGKQHEHFLAPWDLVVHAGGNLYVDDGQLNTISKFSPRGQLMWRIGGPEAADPDLRGAGFRASVDTHDRVVMSNDVAGRILYVDARGHKVDAFGSHDEFSTGPCYVTVDALGYTYADSCGPATAATWVFDRAHRLVGEWQGPDDPLMTSPFFAPDGQAFALGWDGSILKLKVALPNA